MRYGALSLGCLALAALLAACADQPSIATDPLDPVFSAASAESSQVIQAVRGSGHLTQAGELRTFTFNAEKHFDGSVRGKFEIIARQVDRVVHGAVTCMTVFGDAAWLGGVIDRDDSGVSTGAQARFRVVDLGQAPGGSPDLTSLLSFTFVPGAAQAYCNAAPFFPPLLFTESGEIVVTQPGSLSFTSSVVIPISIGVFVPCALNGAGEVVFLSGDLHSLFHFTDDGAGGFHVTVENNPQGVSGTGLTSGDKYQGTGVTREDFNSGPLPFNDTFVNNFRIIGEGTGNNLLIHATFHITVNANGEVTAIVDNFMAECQ